MSINLKVKIEINGEFVNAGSITGNDYSDAVFSYDEEYSSNSEQRPISMNFPKEKKFFTPLATRNFFEGLLPEGFTRRFIAKTLRADNADYIAILRELGSECIGAIKIVDETRDIPEAGYKQLNGEEVCSLAAEGATRSVDLVVRSHLSLTGASGKVGLYHDEASDTWYQPVGDAPSTHIVKQSHIRLENIVTNEQLCLKTAEKLGITVPPSFILDTGRETGSITETDHLSQTHDGSVLFATQRYDRVFKESTGLSVQDVKVIDGLPAPHRLHQEDFAQALGINSVDKYERPGGDYLKKVFSCILRNSASPMEDALGLWRICIFNYMIGNTDNHIKNISLLYSEDMRSIRLAPAYDIVSTLVYPSGTEEMSVSVNNKLNIRTITKEDFLLEARKIGMGKGFVSDIYDEMYENFLPALENTTDELTSAGFAEAGRIAHRIIEEARWLNAK